MHIIHYKTRVFYMTKNLWIPMQTDTIAGFWSPTCQKTHIFIPLISPRQVEHGLTFSSPGLGYFFLAKLRKCFSTLSCLVTGSPH